ncbi:MAG TPA: Hpt domain-containing protein [Rhodanobacteraceae bacterium]|nr:Hpt domain-containing protein [Rhodanobacteraceae bacterium]
MAKDVDFTDPAFLEQIEALRRHFLQGLPERRTALIAAWSGCADGGDEAPWLALRDVAHKLSGSAACYGLDPLGEAGRELDKLLSGRTPCRMRATAAPLVAHLEALLDTAIPPA